jgi:hypothetical protein
MTGTADEDVSAEARRVPAMAYFGIRSRGAAALRMVGVPSAAAEGLAVGN